MKVFAIAKKVNVCHSHGLYIDELQIQQKCPYASDFDWNPLFINKEDAEGFALKHMRFNSVEIVELDVILNQKW